MQSLLAQDYPAARIEILVYCTDESDPVARRAQP